MSTRYDSASRVTRHLSPKCEDKTAELPLLPQGVTSVTISNLKRLLSQGSLSEPATLCEIQYGRTPASLHVDPNRHWQLLLLSHLGYTIISTGGADLFRTMNPSYKTRWTWILSVIRLRRTTLATPVTIPYC
jgi:hypothetical protein